MGNDAQSLSVSNLRAVHVPEPDETYDPAAHDDPNHVTGFVDIVADVNGAPVVIARRKASGLFADIERAKVTGPSADAPSDQG